MGRNHFSKRIGHPRANEYGLDKGIGGIARGATEGGKKTYEQEPEKSTDRQAATRWRWTMWWWRFKRHKHGHTGTRQKERSEAKRMKRGKSYRMAMVPIEGEGEGGESGRKEI